MGLGQGRGPSAAEDQRRPTPAMLAVLRYTVLTRGWPTWARYAMTFCLVVVATGLRATLGPEAVSSPFLLYFLAIILASALFDHGTGVFAVLLSAALGRWFFMAPVHSLDLGGPGEIVDLALFVAIGIVSATIFEALHRVASDLASANRRLLATEGEKDMLLGEASHRVKNELTMVTALLRLQERSITDDAARAALSSTANRVHVLARVHERLERANDEAVVDTREFVSALCDDLKAALVELRPINLVVEAQSHKLRQDRAVPMGLVINELVTNALKYAFPDDRPGAVRVSFEGQGREFVLTIADNGVGMGTDRKLGGSGLGQKLVRSMVAQLEGTVEITPDSGVPGTVATVRFPSEA